MLYKVMMKKFRPFPSTWLLECQC